MSVKSIAVVIVTYNAEYYIEECLNSLLQTDYPKDKFKIIVVDNASIDFSMRILNEYKVNFPERFLIYSSDENTGFAAGNNLGINLAHQGGYDYVYLLNQDTVTDPGFLKEAVKEIETDEKLAGVQSRLMLYTQKEKLNSAGNQIHFLGYGITGGYGKNFSDKIYADNMTIGFPSGAACMLRAEVLEKFGVFNEDFFMYCEDLELAWRLRLAGYNFKLAPFSVVYHKYKFSSSPKKFFYIERNRLITVLSNYKAGTIFLLLPALFAMEAGMLVYSAFGGWFTEKLKASFSLLRPEIIRQIKRNRKRIKELRIRQDKEIISGFIAIIDFEEVNNFLLTKIANPLFSLYWFIVKRFIIW
jgi:GT2 family glycosyltransferase